jgi:hypothetical protein
MISRKEGRKGKEEGSLQNANPIIVVLNTLMLIYRPQRCTRPNDGFLTLSPYG